MIGRIELTVQVWKEGDIYVARAAPLDVVSCGESLARRAGVPQRRGRRVPHTGPGTRVEGGGVPRRRRRGEGGTGPAGSPLDFTPSDYSPQVRC